MQSWQNTGEWQPVLKQDMLPGDEVVHTSWDITRFEDHFWIIISNDFINQKLVCSRKGAGKKGYKYTYPYSRFGSEINPTEWWRKVSHKDYDPNQQKDEEDDI